MIKIRFKQNFVMFVDITTIDGMFSNFAQTKQEQRHIQMDTIMTVQQVVHLSTTRCDLVFTDGLSYKEVAHNIDKDYIEIQNDIAPPRGSNGGAGCCGGEN